jgi:hypothetical protein
MITALRFRRLQRSSPGVLLVALVLVGGCAPSLDPQEYGQVIHEIPKVEGADEPYPLPQLEEPPAEKKDAEK